MKQVIVIRKDLNMRKGKMIAQGCHASIDAFLKATKNVIEEWDKTGHKKICVGCDSEDELVALFEAARKLSLPCSLIIDSGLTEFNGMPTKTAVAIGPGNDEDINKITGELKLL